MSIKKELFGKAKDGQEVYIYTLENVNGLQAKVMNYGAVLMSLKVPDRKGRFADVVFGYDTLEEYLTDNSYFGPVIGRYANRIAKAEFVLNGKTYHLNKNEGENHIHGGPRGFSKAVWKHRIVESNGKESVLFSYDSPDGEEGYPGALNINAQYTLSDDSALEMEYFGVSDQDTVINLTSHAYFNLGGHASGSIEPHELMINADKFTVVDKESLSTGELRNVEGTPLDFRQMKPIGRDINSQYEQMIFGHGFDHNFVLNAAGDISQLTAKVHDPASGRIIEVYTTKPGMQFYSGNFLNGNDVGKGGTVYNLHCGLCLETQYYPNSLAHEHFPSPIFRANQEYRHKTVLKFSVD